MIVGILGIISNNAKKANVNDPIKSNISVTVAIAKEDISGGECFKGKYELKKIRLLDNDDVIKNSSYIISDINLDEYKTNQNLKKGDKIKLSDIIKCNAEQPREKTYNGSLTYSFMLDDRNSQMLSSFDSLNLVDVYIAYTINNTKHVPEFAPANKNGKEYNKIFLSNKKVKSFSKEKKQITIFLSKDEARSVLEYKDAVFYILPSGDGHSRIKMFDIGNNSAIELRGGS